MAEHRILFAFFMRTNLSSRLFQTVVDTASDEKWVANIRKLAAMPGAEVILIRDEDWTPPNLEIQSLTDSEIKSNYPIIIENIQNTFVSRGLAPMTPQEVDQNMGYTGVPSTGLLVFVVKHTGEKSTTQKKSWQFWRK